MPPLSLVFPKNFVWGTATSAHQVEGGQQNDWTAWEPGKILDGSVSGPACDHWNRYAEDYALARSLGTTAHRFSVEWSRIEPEHGTWDDAALQHYRNVVASLRQHGLEPWVTLHHFTNPRWLAERGGWANRDAPRFFVEYVERVVRALPDIQWWITINEPEVLTELGYVAGHWPPQKKSLLTALHVRKNLAQAHQLAYAAIHHILPDAQVGMANNLVAFEPKQAWNPLDQLGVWMARRWHNQWFLQQARKAIDYVGVNYYTRTRVSFQPWKLQHMFPGKVPAGAHVSDMGWEIFPPGLGRVIDQVSSFRKPVYILENGIADADDSRRAAFIRDHLYVLAQKISQGRDVRGYFHWSLLDNFEWREGFAKRFGLIEVDFHTQERRVRKSAETFAAYCKQ